MHPLARHARAARRCSLLLATTLLCAMLCALFSTTLEAAQDRPPTASRQPAPQARGFFANRGQIRASTGAPAGEVRYHAFIGNARVYCTPTGLSLVFLAPRESGAVSEATGRALQAARPATPEPYRLDMRFLGANPAPELMASEPLGTRLNFYLPQCPDGITGIEGQGVVRYRDLYPNIDLVLHAGSEGLKWECIVRPGGNPADICIRYEGAERIEPCTDGSLRVHWPGGAVCEGSPISFAEGTGDEDRSGDDAFIPTRYCVAGTTVRLEVGAYDAAQTLVIDPWATYFGGSREEEPTAIACDSLNGAVFGGYSHSSNFPVHHAWQDSLSGEADGVLVRLDSTGQVRWSTYFGGRIGDGIADLAIDGTGSIVLIGTTSSPDLPVHNGFQMRANIVYGNRYDSSDAFLAKFDTAGVRTWATYFGGSLREMGRRIDVDGAGNIFACGETRSYDLPVYRAHQPNLASSGELDIFYLKMTPDGHLIYASYYGGASEDVPQDLAAHPSGWFVISGGSSSLDFPLLNARQPVRSNLYQAVQMRIDSSGAPLWATYFGGNRSDGSRRVSIDADGNILFAGNTSSTDLRMKRAAQWTLHGTGDCYLMKCTPSGAIIWSTYWGGGSAFDWTGGLGTDRARNVVLGGSTASADFPVLHAAYPLRIDSGDVVDAFLSKFDSAGVLRWSTYFGGHGGEGVADLALDKTGRVLALLSTSSRDEPCLNAVQDSLADGPLLGATYQGDAFIAQFDVNGFIPVVLSALTADWGAGGVELRWTTEREDNAYGFIIERRTGSPGPQGPWTRIGFVAARNPRGARYAFTDATALAPIREVLDAGEGAGITLSYRLRMVDLDGSEALSPEVELTAPTEATTVRFETVWPAPARDWAQLTFTLPGDAAVTLTAHAVTGEQISTISANELLAAGRHVRLVRTTDWPSGLYLFTLSSGTTRLVQRVMVMR